MGLLKIMERIRSEENLSAIAEKVARQCREQVWQTVSSRAGSLGPAEARGYLRVRSKPYLQARISKELEGAGGQVAAMASRIESLASELVIRDLVIELIEQPFPSRRAA